MVRVGFGIYTRWCDKCKQWKITPFPNMRVCSTCSKAGVGRPVKNMFSVKC